MENFCPTEVLPWIQNQDPKKLFAVGIGMILIVGTAVLLGFRALKTSLGHINEDDATKCSICFEPFSNNGTHRLSSLQCGHFYGTKCIENWLIKRGCKYCPICRKKATKRNIRHHYVDQLF